MALDKTPIQVQTFARVPTIREFAEFFMENYATSMRNKYSERVSKRQILDGYILPMFGDFKLNEITNTHIDIFVRRLAEAGAAPKSINNRLAVLSKLLKYAHKRKLLDVVPAWEPVKPRAAKIRFLSDEEVPALLAAAADHGPYWFAMVVVGVHLGLRNGEIRALHWNDINWKRKTITINRADWRGVTSEPKTVAGVRTLPLNEAVVAALKALKPLGALVFGKPPKGTLISHETTRNRLKRMMLDAGIKGASWHTLRHTFASHLVMAGTPLRVVQELLGHATIQMTMRYSHLSPESKSNAADILVDLFKPRKS